MSAARLSTIIVLSLTTFVVAESPAFALPGLGAVAPAANSSSSADPSALSASIDAMATKFDAGGKALIDAQIKLVDALGKTEAAGAAKSRAADVGAQGASAEKNAEMVKIAEGLTTVLEEASKESGELDAAAKERIRKADGDRFTAAASILALLPDVAALGLSVADLGQRVATGAVDAKTFKSIKTSFDGLSTSVKFFDGQNKTVAKLMKTIYQTRKIEPAKYTTGDEKSSESKF